MQDFTKDNPDLRKFYVYQSIIRLANQGQDPNFNKLIKGIRKLDVYVSRRDSLADHTVLAELHRGLRDEGYDRLIEADISEGKLVLHNRTARNQEFFLATLMETAGRLVILEIDGTFDLKYLMTIQQMDFGILQELVLENRGIDFD